MQCFYRVQLFTQKATAMTSGGGPCWLCRLCTSALTPITSIPALQLLQNVSQASSPTVVDVPIQQAHKKHATVCMNESHGEPRMPEKMCMSPGNAGARDS